MTISHGAFTHIAFQIKFPTIMDKILLLALLVFNIYDIELFSSFFCIFGMEKFPIIMDKITGYEF